VRLDDRLAARVAVEAGRLELHAERGDGEGDEQAAGASAMSAYYYFANKERLLDGMVDVVFGEIEPP
jgi:hypothetical protein